MAEEEPQKQEGGGGGKSEGPSDHAHQQCRSLVPSGRRLLISFPAVCDGSDSCAGAAKTASGEEVDFKDISLAEAFKILEVRLSCQAPQRTRLSADQSCRQARRSMTSFAASHARCAHATSRWLGIAKTI